MRFAKNYTSIQTGSNQRNTFIKKKRLVNFLKRDWQLYLLLSIPLIFLIIFNYLPMAGLSIAFLDYDIIKGIANSEFVGFDIFKEIFSMSDFTRAFRNTVVLNVLDLIVGFPMPIIVAILLNEIKNIKFKRISQTALYLPHFLSWVIIAGIMTQLLSTNYGIVNTIIKGFGGEAIPFLTEKYHWVGTYIIIGVWQSFGWGTIIYLAAITGISSELYEAAIVDGANRWQQIIYITLPGIKSTAIILLIMRLGRIMMGSFERAYLIGNPIVIDFSKIFSVFIYEVGLRSYRYNVATAVGLFQSFIGFSLVLIANWLAKKIDEGLI